MVTTPVQPDTESVAVMVTTSGSRGCRGPCDGAGACGKRQAGGQYKADTGTGNRVVMDGDGAPGGRDLVPVHNTVWAPVVWPVTVIKSFCWTHRFSPEGWLVSPLAVTTIGIF